MKNLNHKLFTVQKKISNSSDYNTTNNNLFWKLENISLKHIILFALNHTI